MLRQIPVSSYRVQLNASFGFQEAKGIVPYLKKLGIHSFYASPIMKARRGSLHGYDITDYSQLNPELGTEEDFEELVEALKSYDMGLIADIVPNHMCINDSSNRWWWDVLENGRSSPFASYFDIEWEPPKKELVNKVLLPFLDDQFGKVIESYRIKIELTNGAFILKGPYCTLPVNPKAWELILSPVKDELQKIWPQGDLHLTELKSILFEIEHLPESHETDPKLKEERQIEKEVIKKRLRALIEESQTTKETILKQLDKINHRKGDFKLLEEILKMQAYRLSYWKVSSEEINYRRFFDIDDLAGIRTEEYEVFSQVHEVILGFISKGWVTGLRIDHVDGLLDPEQYFFDLQQACKEAAATQAEKGFYIVAEKILTGEEELPSHWLIDGTTGYDFLNSLNGLFIDPKSCAPIFDFYQRFTEQFDKIPSIIYKSKEFILRFSMTAELNVLGRLLDAISEQHRWSRDFTRENLLSALRNVISCFSVYRTYIRPDIELIHEHNRKIIVGAIRKAKKLNPAISASVFDFIQSVLLLEHPSGLSDKQISVRKDFVLRFQQLTGPVMAKGVEDTAFYRTYPLASINEVGGELNRFGTTIEAFHQRNCRTQKSFPHSFSATSTHDTKRSEDVRARMNVLSEIPEKWCDAVLRWNIINKQAKSIVDEEIVPGNHEEYLIYQTLLGTWPLDVNFSNLKAKEKELKNYEERIVAYILKAMKEAKINTSWVSPNDEYDQAMESFIRGILNPALSEQFLEDFLTFLPQIINFGMYNSLAQILLKTTSPGVPDFYQGCEVWNFRLVDPDNRQCVDFPPLKEMLEEITEEGVDQISLIESALKTLESGKIKIFITQKALLFRERKKELFSYGKYTPIKILGKKSDHVIAFAREDKESCAITLAARFFAKLTKGSKSLTYPSLWKETFAEIPKGFYREVFTGKTFEIGDSPFPLKNLFTKLPLALLERQ